MAKKILLADDSITIQKVISITFSSEDYELVIVGDGDAAVKKAKETRPDLIMADVAMPGKTGYEVCEAVKGDPALANVPVLLLAGTFEPLNKDEALRVGADDSIVKPFESQELLDKVRELLSRRGEVAGEYAAASVPQTEPPKLEVSSDIWDSGDFLGFTDEFEEKKDENAASADLEFLEGGLFEEPKELSLEGDFTDLVIHETEYTKPVEKPAELHVEEKPFEPFEFESNSFDLGAPAEEAKKTESFEVEPFDVEPFKPETNTEVEPFGKAFWADSEIPSSPSQEKEIIEPDFLETPDEIVAEPEPVREQPPLSVVPFERPYTEHSRPLREIMEPAPAQQASPEVSQVSEEAVRRAVEEAADRVAERIEARLIEDINLKIGKSDAQVSDAIARAAARVEEKLRDDLAAKLNRAETQIAETVERAASKIEERLRTELPARLERSLSAPKEQVEAIVSRTAKEVIERVAWEVIPEMAERLIKAEINRVKDAFLRRE